MTIIKVLLSCMVGLLLVCTQAQAAVNVDQLSQCMVTCNGDKNCVDNCVSAATPRGTAKDVLQCLAGCGLKVTSLPQDASLKEQIKACCEGCLGSMQ